MSFAYPLTELNILSKFYENHSRGKDDMGADTQVKTQTCDFQLWPCVGMVEQ